MSDGKTRYADDQTLAYIAKLLKAINDLDAVWLRTDTHSRVRDTDLGWHIANVRGIAQEDKP